MKSCKLTLRDKTSCGVVLTWLAAYTIRFEDSTQNPWSAASAGKQTPAISRVPQASELQSASNLPCLQISYMLISCLLEPCGSYVKGLRFNARTVSCM